MILIIKLSDNDHSFITIKIENLVKKKNEKKVTFQNK